MVNINLGGIAALIVAAALAYTILTHGNVIQISGTGTTLAAPPMDEERCHQTTGRYWDKIGARCGRISDIVEKY
jgi:hypothetical protein